MATLAGYGDAYIGHFCKERAFTNSDVAFIKVGNIMVSIHLLDSLQTSSFDHGLCASWSFFSWLKQNPNKFIGRHLPSTVEEYPNSTQLRHHVAIMPTHMSIVGLARIL